jgi:hypothetical protein
MSSIGFDRQVGSKKAVNTFGGGQRYLEFSG